MRIQALGLLALVAALHAGQSLAEDIVTEQYVASATLRELDKAKSQMEADQELVKLRKQHFEEAKKQLAFAEKKAALSKTRYLKAKENFDKQEIAVERAWKQ